jgi:hypothetical protein
VNVVARLLASTGLFLCALVLPLNDGAFADSSCSGTSSTAITSTAAGAGMNIGALEAVAANCPEAEAAHLLEGEWHQAPMCDMGGAATCAEVAHCQDGSILINQWFETTAGAVLYESATCPQVAVAVPEVDSNAVLRALRRIGLPGSELVVQPPGGETLVNFATNFYTEQGEFTRTVRLLGRRVELRIWPSEFGWRFGDGESLVSVGAGAPYPDLEITHEYRVGGRVGPRVDTTYAAEFSVDGGPWRAVNGTVTIPGVPVRLQVRTASPVLVGYH